MHPILSKRTNLVYLLSNVSNIIVLEQLHLKFKSNKIYASTNTATSGVANGNFSKFTTKGRTTIQKRKAS